MKYHRKSHVSNILLLAMLNAALVSVIVVRAIRQNISTPCTCYHQKGNFQPNEPPVISESILAHFQLDLILHPRSRNHWTHISDSVLIESIDILYLCWLSFTITRNLNSLRNTVIVGYSFVISLNLDNGGSMPNALLIQIELCKLPVFVEFSARSASINSM